VTPPPTLKNLLYSLEAANSHPSSALNHLKQLSKDADRVVEKLDLVESMFVSTIDDSQIEEHIETFMQNS